MIGILVWIETGYCLIEILIGIGIGILIGYCYYLVGDWIELIVMYYRSGCCYSRMTFFTVFIEFGLF